LRATQGGVQIHLDLLIIDGPLEAVEVPCDAIGTARLLLRLRHVTGSD